MASRGIVKSCQVQLEQALANVAIADEIRDDDARAIWSARGEVLTTQSSGWCGKNITSDDTRPPLPRHVFVCVHGIYGKAQDSDLIAAALTREFGSSALVYQSTANTHKTHMGIRAMGTNLAIELLDLFHNHCLPELPPHDGEPPMRISFVGHSLGGIISRYAVVYLQVAFQAYHIHPTSFSTLCTPHLGSRRPDGTVGQQLWKSAVHGIMSVSLIYGQTGVELLCEDHVKEPLLEAMSKRDSVFMKALKAFDHRTAVAMIQGDHIVPYASAAIQAHVTHPCRDLLGPSNCSWQWTLAHSGFSEPTSKFTTLLHATYGSTRCEVNASSLSTSSPASNVIVDERGEVSISTTMLAGLNSISWRRLHVHVHYGGPWQWYWLSFHTWPLGIQMPASSRSSDFIDLFVRMLMDDHKTDAATTTTP
ncbi:hypothetical protein H310_05122 [Aphanomyces invadans]|uniref:DUF676 domain-containing protein n=1 Tax=Aphanomyces invadans TaxID=157072 RepID=A0A024UBV3_9STRA|nr:hypothetical protein H310_05122 [Aphanomyces invadans]ETW03754.1 hypothetical protein H310_05122 [Aphanomyces invadans]|eukprot:XP_008867983.1 hypothetical protein H310_05122 [Aphanomyces invadans]